MPSKTRVWDILEYVLGVIAVVSLISFVYLNMSAELRDPDIWLHLKTGEYILQHKSIPQVDIFSSTMRNKPWIDHSWLVQVIFYLVFHFAGADNLIFLSALVVVSAFLLLFFSVYKERQYLGLIAPILFLAIFASRTRFNIRPENFSLLFLAIYIFSLCRHIRSKRIFILPLVQLFWVNCHGFFILGPLLLGIFILAERLKRSRALPWEWSQMEVLDKRSYQNLLRVFWLVCLACFLNPYGYRGALYPVWTSFDVLGKTAIFNLYIQELIAPWRMDLESFRVYYILAALSLALFLLRFKRINLAYFMLWLIFLGLSFRINRNIIYFNFIAFFTTAQMLTHSTKASKASIIENFFGRSIYLVKYAILVMLIFQTLSLTRSLLNSTYYIFEEDRTKSALLGINVRRNPQKAADFVLEKNLPGNMFNLFNHGSYLIYRLFPENRVFIDGRTELYGGDFFKVYQKILKADQETINDIFKRFGISTVFLSGRTFEVGNLAGYFFGREDWALVYFDTDALIFLKKAPQNEALISKLKVDLKKWQLVKIDLDKIGIRNVFPEPYVRRAWLFYYLGLYKQALQEAREVLRILPSNPDANTIIGKIHTQDKLYPEAFESLRLSYIYGPSDEETLIAVGDLYTQWGKTKEAISIYKNLIKFHPYSPKGYYLLAGVYKQQKKLKSAIKLMHKAIELDPFDSGYYKDLGSMLYEGGNPKGAAKIYNNAIKLGLDAKAFRELLSGISK